MSRPKLLFGICGIGKGHIYRQAPIISYFEKNCDIAIFAFGESYYYFKKFYSKKENIKVFKVFVPWIYGNLNGIDYLRTAKDSFNKKNNYVSQNFSTINKVFQWLGKVDLIISDYEPISAQYAYSLNIPLITIDQQSKFFYDGYPNKLDDLSYQEERARLNLFFPYANERIACSFFNTPKNTIKYRDFKIKIIPSIIRDEIITLKQYKEISTKQIIVYLSPYSPFVQSTDEVISILSLFTEHFFHLFVSKKSDFSDIRTKLPKNIKVSFHDDTNFLTVLQNSGSAICTAGHMFISEMMFLNKPVYAIPLHTYEQKYNAKVISDNKFGVTSSGIKSDILKNFLKKLPVFKNNIINDKKVLLNKKLGQNTICCIIEKMISCKYTKNNLKINSHKKI